MGSKSSSKIFYVTEFQAWAKREKRIPRIFGFVSVFGWEDPVDKASKKYPHRSFSLVEKPKTTRRTK